MGFRLSAPLEGGRRATSLRTAGKGRAEAGIRSALLGASGEKSTKIFRAAAPARYCLPIPVDNRQLED